MITQEALKKQVVAAVDELPRDALEEVVTFLDYLQYKLAQRSSQHIPYKPVALGGLWAGITITEEDIAEVRHEMWEGFGERKP